MPRRRSSFAKTIDYEQWTLLPGIQIFLNGNATFSGASVVFNEPATILRVRGWWSAHFDSTMQVGDELDLGIGLAILSTDAFTLGPTAFPDPLGEPEYPWLFWDTLKLDSNRAVGENAYGTTAQWREIDTKAMRKVKPGESLVVVLQSAGAAGAPNTVLEQSRMRVLIGT